MFFLLETLRTLMGLTGQSNYPRNKLSHCNTTNQKITINRQAYLFVGESYEYLVMYKFRASVNLHVFPVLIMTVIWHQLSLKPRSWLSFKLRLFPPQDSRKLPMRLIRTSTHINKWLIILHLYHRQLPTLGRELLKRPA